MTTMKTNSTQPRKDIFNDSFFVRKPIIDNAVNTDAGNHHVKKISNEPSIAFSYKQPHNMKCNSEKTLKLGLAANDAGNKINAYLQKGKVNHSPFVTPSEARGPIDHSPH